MSTGGAQILGIAFLFANLAESEYMYQSLRLTETFSRDLRSKIRGFLNLQIIVNRFIRSSDICLLKSSSRKTCRWTIAVNQ